MKNKWFLKLLGSLLAVFLITGCNADDNDPPPEDDGVETPGDDLGDNNDTVPDVTPEEDVVPGDNNGNDMNGDNNMNNGNDMNGTDNNNDNVIGDENNDGDLDIGNDDNDELGDNDLTDDDKNNGDMNGNK